MATLLYSPGVKVLIATARHGILDVSDDLIQGSTSMSEDQMGSFSFTLNNARRKYDGVFTPNDRVVVRMKRVAWVPVFSGYLNSVPFKSIFPRQVPLTASCTLKRLMYRYWDPTTPASVDLLDTKGNGQGFASGTDGGIRDRVMRLLTEVGGWEANAIHIGALPGDWFDKVAGLQTKLASRVIVDVDSLGGDATTGGSTLTSLGTTKVPGGGPYTGVLPDTKGKISWFGGAGGGAYGKMALTGESGVNPDDPWYCAMRWPYQLYVNGKITRAPGPISDISNARNWWKNRKILVINPKTNSAVVLRAADWGPGGVHSADNRAIDVSKMAMERLGATTDTKVEIRFADPSLPLGEITGKGMILRRTDPLGEEHPITASGDGQMKGPTGLRFAAADGLQPHVAAAREFIRGAWAESAPGKNSIGGLSKRNIAGSSRPSDHSFGLALDVGNGAGANRPTAAQLAHGTSVAAWFVQNPNVFGTKYVIWNNKINMGDGKGWVTYAGGQYRNNMNLGHFNHVHISFKNKAQGAPSKVGPTGGSWAGSDMKGFPNYEPVGGGPVGSPYEGDNLIQSYLWTNRTSEAGEILSGIRALMNDTPLFGSVQALINASMRSFMSGPNGDLIAWFPDYFGMYKTAGRMHIKDIELAGDGFTLTWSDERLKTHLFATGSWDGFNDSGGTGGPVDLYNQFQTAGIATVEYPEIMEALFNLDPKDPWARDFLDSDKILQRYGARPEVINMGEISGPQAEFWLAMHLFQRNWARQFSATVELTFMPEVYPGMLLYLESYGLQVYVTGVAHSFDFESGFFTRVTVVAPSATDGSGLFGLPRSVVL